MKVKQEILDRINNVTSRKRILEFMGSEYGDQALYKQIKDNSEDGPLTKMKAVLAISKETGIPVDQILEEEEEHETVNK